MDEHAQLDHPVNCLHERDFGTLWEIIKAHSIHVVEGDKSGGFRDRLMKVEIEVKEIRERFWWSALVGGIIGALIGSGSKDIITCLIGWIMKR